MSRTARDVMNIILRENIRKTTGLMSYPVEDLMLLVNEIETLQEKLQWAFHVVVESGYEFYSESYEVCDCEGCKYVAEALDEIDYLCDVPEDQKWWKR